MSYYLLRPTQSECKTMLTNYTKIYTAKRYNYNVKSVYRSTSTDSNIIYTQYFCKFWELLIMNYPLSIYVRKSASIVLKYNENQFNQRSKDYEE